MPTTWVMACAYGPSGTVVACGYVYDEFHLSYCAVFRYGDSVDNTVENSSVFSLI